MCFFKSKGSSGKAANVSSAPTAKVAAASSSVEAEKAIAAKKGRLLFTEGENKGQQLQASQGATIRKIFGN